MTIDSILHYLFYIKAAIAAYDIIPDAQILKIELISKFEKFLAMNVISVHPVYDIGIADRR